MTQKAEGIILSGKSVRFVTPAEEPQGAVLSCSAPHARSGGQRKAAGPISVAAFALHANRQMRPSKAVNDCTMVDFLKDVTPGNL